MQSTQVVYLCKAVLLWLNASLGFHMQFTEDIYLRVNQTTQQNTTQDNKTFICKLSRRQDKGQETNKAKCPPGLVPVSQLVPRNEFVRYNVLFVLMSSLLVVARLGPR